MPLIDPLIQNLPRRVLVYMSSAFVGIVILVGSNVYADSQKTKVVAYDAKRTAENALELSKELKIQISDVRGAIEINRKEYREDRNKDADLMRAMEDRIIRAVKS